MKIQRVHRIPALENIFIEKTDSTFTVLTASEIKMSKTMILSFLKTNYCGKNFEKSTFLPIF